MRGTHEYIGYFDIPRWNSNHHSEYLHCHIQCWKKQKDLCNNQNRYSEFLRNLGASFKDSDLISGSNPPDVIFKNAAFEIKEIDEKNRKRGDEYKEKIKQAKSAKTLKDLYPDYQFKEINLPEIINRINEVIASLVYDSSFCEKTDLLFYINYSLIGEHNYTITANDAWIKWRSISMLTNNNTSCVLFANDTAPEFVKAVKGKIIKRNC